MSQGSPPPRAEKRRVIRARRRHQALCVFDEGSSSVDVTVRNISPVGARIAGDGLICLPSTFEFRIHDDDGGYAVRQARLVWAKATTAGIAFID